MEFQSVQHYLSEVACDFHIVPGVVVEFAIDRLDNGLEGSGTQVDDQRNGPIFQGQVDVVCWLARVKDKAISLPSLEGQCDLVAAALDGILRQVVAEVLGTSECGHILFSRYKSGKKIVRTSWNKTNPNIQVSWNKPLKECN